MIGGERFVAAAAERGFGLFSGVPCSYLTQFINQVIADPRVAWVPAANEGDAVAIASGAQLGGTRGVAMMQNSGLGNAVSPLTSLNHVFRLPLLLIVSLRGDPDGAPDEPQHALMGRITTEMLDTMRIPWRWMADTQDELEALLDQACAWMDSEQLPFALVVRKGAVGGDAPSVGLDWQPARPPYPPIERPLPQVQRREMLQAVCDSAPRDAAILATTGFTGRELYAIDDSERHFYMVGSMGCVGSVALGLALVQPQRPVIVLDGDGAMLMRMGALPVIGALRPPNLLHLLLDNGVHESTGGQANVSPAIDYPGMALCCGYPHSTSLASPEALAQLLAGWSGGLGFVHLPVLPGIRETLPRPSVTPPEVARRLRAWLEQA